MVTTRDGVQGANEADGVLANLRFSLQLLAAPGQEQISHFALPDFAYKADEIALEFDHWASCVGTYWPLSPRQTRLLTVLNEFLDTTGHEAGTAFWSDQALLDHPGWEQARAMAKAALAAFGWGAEIPPHEEIISIEGQG